MVMLPTTTLATARTIAGQSFDGSANITIAIQQIYVYKCIVININTDFN